MATFYSGKTNMESPFALKPIPLGFSFYLLGFPYSAGSPDARRRSLPGTRPTTAARSPGLHRTGGERAAAAQAAGSSRGPPSPASLSSRDAARGAAQAKPLRSARVDLGHRRPPRKRQAGGGRRCCYARATVDARLSSSPARQPRRFPRVTSSPFVPCSPSTAEAFLLQGRR